jgi:hypothetical protein
MQAAQLNAKLDQEGPAKTSWCSVCIGWLWGVHGATGGGGGAPESC